MALIDAIVPTQSASPTTTKLDIKITINYKGQQHTYTFGASSFLSDLSTRLEQQLVLPQTSQKFLISPKPGLLKPPFSAFSTNGDIPLSSLVSRKITLIGSTPAELTSLDTAIATSQRQVHRRPGLDGPIKAAIPVRTRDWKTLHDSTAFTFGSIKPLPYLPKPQRSQLFLERLASDPGIKAVMAAHKWSVGLLTEMNPAEHTTHESRTLGLNRNAGEVIELRLRTDAYDGYRDYKTIRKTLCHELTHNVFSEHDRQFWDLCGQVEKEVDRADWKRGGRTVGEEEFYNPGDRAEHERNGHVYDHGIWTGDAHVLGTAAVNGIGSNSTGGDRRDIMAKAAEDRARRQQGQGPPT